MIIKPDHLDLLPDTSGVYIYRDDKGIIIYIGKAVNLKKRVSSYFKESNSNDKSRLIAGLVSEIELIRVESEFEALLLEARLINSRKPKYNVIWRDDKSYIYIEVTGEIYPRVLLSRKKSAKGRLFGPYPSSRTAREIVRSIRNIFPFCTQRLPAKKKCFYSHLGLCDPCPADIEKIEGSDKLLMKRQYKNNLRRIVSVLSGNSGKVRAALEKEMKKKSLNKEYEKAAGVRDRLKNLEMLEGKGFYLDRYIENSDVLDKKYSGENVELRSVLEPYFSFPKNLKVIECYDISNTQGTLATGSMVTFRGSYPDKTRYRHFRIRTIDTPNDFEMLKEVFSRRFKHKEWTSPDLLVVDGGAQQLEILLNVLDSFALKIPAISLAKKFEEIYVRESGNFMIIRLPRNSGALNLLKRLRDESHRFANSYHRKLRLKNLLGLLPN